MMRRRHRDRSTEPPLGALLAATLAKHSQIVKILKKLFASHFYQRKQDPAWVHKLPSKEHRCVPSVQTADPENHAAFCQSVICVLPPTPLRESTDAVA